MINYNQPPTSPLHSEPVSDRIRRFIFDKRLLFVVGKGGTGKTTTSLALALAAELLNQTVLLVELNDSEMIGRTLKNRPLSSSPEKIRSHIWAARTDPYKELEAYVHEHVNVKFIAKKITGSKLFDHLAAATPGLKEAMTLGKIWRWEQEKKTDGTPCFDLIIVDAPASGHGQSLLRVPQTVIDMIQIGPIAEQTKIVLSLIQDVNKTGIVLVTLPEELPINEAIEFQKIAIDELRMSLLLTVVNCMRPKTFTVEETRYLNEVLEANELKTNERLLPSLLKAAEHQIRRRKIQEAYYSQLEEQSSNPIMSLPYFYTNKLKKSELDEIAHLLLKKSDKHYA